MNPYIVVDPRLNDNEVRVAGWSGIHYANENTAEKLRQIYKDLNAIKTQIP